MAIGIYFGHTGLDVDRYNECMKRLKKAGAAHPVGRSYHSSFGPPDKVMVFDVWTSQTAFDKLGKTLMPILQQLGAEPGPPEIMQIHNVVKAPRSSREEGCAREEGGKEAARHEALRCSRRFILGLMA